jgi:hypothetical protein
MLLPSIVDENGKKYLTVARRWIEIPTPDSLSAHYYRSNGFLIYRSLLQKVFQGTMIVDVSQLAGESWWLAGKEFQQFFSNYAHEINSITTKKTKIRQFKAFDPKPKIRQFKSSESKTKRKNMKNNKKNIIFTIEQEVFFSKECESKVSEFEFITNFSNFS